MGRELDIEIARRIGLNMDRPDFTIYPAYSTDLNEAFKLVEDIGAIITIRHPLDEQSLKRDIWTVDIHILPGVAVYSGKEEALAEAICRAWIAYYEHYEGEKA